ncbi:hypothetical protein G9F31_12785 [Acinetobacter sp. 187]|uniref:Uncharacterized protein n=1 Tax=Acinetobacter lanii TaxID=2715163 RepID=A0A6G8S2H1_9GAMM|nr:hypothetical protein [Acinetobacter lanii]NHC04622.1 hypothetical protein [Acinetobacter lanii]QIO08218.1 hypothetical protein G8D99_03735 [Acinetobacter lanii]
MAQFNLGQCVLLASNPELVFEIIAIHQDQTFDIQGQDSAVKHLKYHHIPCEMLRAKAN